MRLRFNILIVLPKVCFLINICRLPTVVVPKVMGKPPTRPEEFQFKTDDRLKTHNMETRQDMSEHKDFNKMLRDHDSSPVCCFVKLCKLRVRLGSNG